MAAKKTKTKKPKRRPIVGLVLHFGYVESNRVAPLILWGPKFWSLRAALADAADYFWEDYAYGHGSRVLSIAEFERFLYDMPTYVASAGCGDVTFDRYHANEERWWPWMTLKQLRKALDNFVEIPASAEEAIIWKLGVEALTPALREELATWKSNHFEPKWKEMGRVGR